MTIISNEQYVNYGIASSATFKPYLSADAIYGK